MYVPRLELNTSFKGPHHTLRIHLYYNNVKFTFSLFTTSEKLATPLTLKKLKAIQFLFLALRGSE